MKNVTVQYYALFRETSGRSGEQIETNAATAEELYSELQSRYGFALTTAQVKVAINEEFGGWTTSLKDGDSIVFIPPVAGG